MSIDKLLAEIEEKTDLKLCAVCGMPFKPYHGRQKTCGDPECRRAYKNEYTKKYVREFKERDPEGARKYHREAQRKYRHKVAEAAEMLKRMHELNEAWDDAVRPYEDGLNYGQRQAEKLLEQVPKIDVNLGGTDGSEIREDNL